MRREDAIVKLKAAEPALRGFGVAGLYLFGSHARDQANADSDVDVFIDPAPGSEFDFVSYMDAHDAIQVHVGRTVDYGTRNGLPPRFEIRSNRKPSGYFDDSAAYPDLAVGYSK